MNGNSPFCTSDVQVLALVKRLVDYLTTPDPGWFSPHQLNLMQKLEADLHAWLDDAATDTPRR